MANRTTMFAWCLAAACLTPAAMADFSGQTVLGPLGPGSSVLGNTIGHADSNDGFTSGDHIFFIWDGGDDAYKLNWPGGDLTVSLFYNNQLCDVDLFLYRPGSLNDSGDYSITNLSPDVVSIPGADAGSYYIVVDSAAGFEGAYQLQVSDVPAPQTATVLLAGGALLARRRRR